MPYIINTIIICLALSSLIAILLTIASIVLSVKKDERVNKVLEILPGNNCGGCGYSGCEGLANAIVKGEAKANACPVGGEQCKNKIEALLGLKSEAFVKKVAFVHCDSCSENTKIVFDYVGTKSCRISNSLSHRGPKACPYACTGYGDCIKVCEFGAIKIVDGVAKVDKDKCTGCMKCIKACPKKLINLVPYDSLYHVKCNNLEKGKQVMTMCKIACIACGICEKNCEAQAIKVINNVANIDYEKCTNCGVCVTKCPRKCIIKEGIC